MKKIFSTLFSFFISLVLFAQKPAIDSSIYDKWPVLGNAKISDDGKYALYWIDNKPVGSQTLVIQSVDGKWKVELPGAIENSSAFFTGDSHRVIAGLPGDSLCIVTLGNEDREYILHANSNYFKVSCNKNADWLAYRLDSGNNGLKIRNVRTGASFNDSPENVDFDFANKLNGILIKDQVKRNDSVVSRLRWLNLSNGIFTDIWDGGETGRYAFNKDKRLLAFLVKSQDPHVQGYSLWEFNIQDKMTKKLVSDTSRAIQKGYSISNETPWFTQDGAKLFFTVRKSRSTKIPSNSNVGLSIWNYKDRFLPTVAEYSHGSSPSYYTVDIVSEQVICLNDVNESIVLEKNKQSNNYVLVYGTPYLEAFLDSSKRRPLFLESISSGARKLVARQLNPDGFHALTGTLAPVLSPHETFVIWFDIDSMAYFSYEIANGATRNISNSISEKLYDVEAAEVGRRDCFGIADWGEQDRWLLLYDQYDIWKVDLTGQRPSLNITNFTGRKSHIVFSLINAWPLNKTLQLNNNIVLDGFNRDNKENGFWLLNPKSNAGPEKCIMDAHSYYIGRVGITGFIGYASAGEPLKAADVNVFLISRMSATQSPNLFLTSDFKSFHPISALYPENDFNWLTNELMTWKLPDGTLSQGILYKPQNFDSSRKYPLIFDYYEKRSDELNKFIHPGYSFDRINIPTYVSNGYLVFVPDIYFKFGQNGISVVNSVVSAAKYLTTFHWIDSTKLGLQGHSFGGWETNFLITHSHLFAAACEAAGVSDIVSGYGQLQYGRGEDRHLQYELYSQGCPYGLGVTPWTSTQIYINNSPIFFINNITTPLLMMHSMDDRAVPFEQAIEMFTGMKRAGKKVWLLEYKKGGHSLDGNNGRDYTFRMQQFFDHYLKGKLAPVWMTKGTSEDNIGLEDKLKLDLLGAIP